MGWKSRALHQLSCRTIKSIGDDLSTTMRGWKRHVSGACEVRLLFAACKLRAAFEVFRAAIECQSSVHGTEHDYRRGDSGWCRRNCTSGLANRHMVRHLSSHAWVGRAVWCPATLCDS